MLFFTGGRAPALLRSRRSPGSRFDTGSSTDPDSAMKDAGAAMRHAGEDIADAARQVSAEATRQVRANTASVRAEAARQIRANASAVRSNAAAVRANASAMPDELLAASPDAIRKSVEKLVPGRRKRARRRPLFGLLAVLAVAGLALLGVRMLMVRRASLPMPRRKGWDRSPDGSMTGQSTPSQAGGSQGKHPPADVPPDLSTEPATFDRDAGIRAATEGMEPPEPLAPGASRSEFADIADGT
jgi:hypothetical protein